MSHVYQVALLCRVPPNADGDRPHTRTYNAPSVQELASFQPDGGLSPEHGFRAVVAQGRNGNTSILRDIDPHNYPLRFPLLNPFGDIGWHPRLRHATGTGKLTAQDWTAFMLQYRPSRDGPVSLDRSDGSFSSHLLLAGKLLQEFVVDMHSQVGGFNPRCSVYFLFFRYSTRIQALWLNKTFCSPQVEGARLNWLKFNQSKLRSDVYRGLQDAMNAGKSRPPIFMSTTSQNLSV
jgi:hypothetical protein